MKKRSTPEETALKVGYRAAMEVWRREAATTPEAFTSFAMRSEQTQEYVNRLPPHQEIGLAHMWGNHRSVQIWPINHSKSWTATAMALFLVGKYPNGRGAIVSATAAQAEKSLMLMKEYIDGPHSQVFRDVFPGVCRGAGKWTDSQITVQRKPGIKDPTVSAYGLDSKKITGSRLDWIVVDDLLNLENTGNKESRDNVATKFDVQIYSRLEAHEWSRIVMLNSAFHPDDVLHRKEKQGWATLRMQVDGSLYVKDDAMTLDRPWDHELLKPHPEADSSTEGDLGERLTYKGWQPGDMLWKGHPTIPSIDYLKFKYPVTQEFNRLYMSVCRDDGSSFCKSAWIEQSKVAARTAGYKQFIHTKRGGRTFTGVDLAVQQGEEHDSTCLFTFETLPDGRRLVLDIDVGKYDGPTVVEKIIEVHRRYDSIVAVENNACLRPDMQVLTRERGYVRIDDVQVGEYVWTHRARWRPITQVLKGESRTMTKFRVRGGVPLFLTPNHWVYCKDAARGAGRGHGRKIPVGEGKWTSAMMFDRPAYAATAIPRWASVDEPKLEIAANRKRKARVVDVDEEVALMLGLFMAEGHLTKLGLTWTLHEDETDIGDFIADVLKRRFSVNAQRTRREEQHSQRVIAADNALAKAMSGFGKKRDKCAPLEWMGWPLHLRLAIIRGWFLGDGCIMQNNGKTKYAKLFLSGATISRNWLMFVRSTLMQFGLRPSVAKEKNKTTCIDGRVLKSSGCYTLRLNVEDTIRFLELATTPMEMKAWGDADNESTRRSNSPIIIDAEHAWSTVSTEPGSYSGYPDGTVYNLMVEEDESYTAEDIVVHNAQDFIRQFVTNQAAWIPIKAHHTGRNKAHPEHGVVSMFTEIAQKLWLLPNDAPRPLHPAMQKFVDECLYYAPSRHTGDILMAAWIAREQARKFGMLGPETGARGNVADFNLR